MQAVRGRRGGARKGVLTTRKRRLALAAAAARSCSKPGAASANSRKAAAGSMPSGIGARRTTWARDGGSGREIVVGLAAEGLRLPRTRPLGPEEAPSERTEEPEVAQAEVSDMLADGGSRRLGLAEAGPAARELGAGPAAAGGFWGFGTFFFFLWGLTETAPHQWRGCTIRQSNE